MIPSLQRHARVAGIPFEILLIGLAVIQWSLRDDLRLVERNFAISQRLAVRVAEMFDRQTLVIHFPHFVFAVVVRVISVTAITAAAAITPGRFRRAAFPVGYQCQGSVIAGLAHRLEQHVSLGAIDAFQCVDRQPGLRVFVIEKNRQLRRRRLFLGAKCLEPVVFQLFEDASDRRDMFAAGRRRDFSFRRRQRQVVDKSNAETALEGSNFMLAIGIERRELRMESAVRAEVHRLFPSLMADDQFPACVQRRQRNYEGGDHAIQLFAVLMRRKKLPGSYNSSL